jgi:Holliday junction resolvase-like predicted endonuclease
MAEHSILVRKIGSNESWSEPDNSTYENEAHLQDLLAKDPARLPGVPEGAVAVRELSTSVGPIDICVVHPDGEITVVECKLSKNSEKRRMVIGQVIDYAAALRSDGAKSFHENWAQRGGEDLDGFLDPEASSGLDENIASGQINLCLAVDQIDSDLRRLIEYLNLVSRDDVKVTALQLAYAKHGDLEILIPSTFGMELAEAKSAGRSDQARWTWDEFVDSLVQPADVEIAQELARRLDQAEILGSHGKLWFGSKPRGGVFFHIHRQRYCPFQLWRNSAGQLLIYGNWRQWSKLRGDQRFENVAAALGQLHTEGAKGVAASAVDLDAFWSVAVECDRAINQSDD